MLVLKIKVTVILFSLLALFCIPTKIYCQMVNLDNLLIYLDKKELNKNDKKMTIKIKPVKNNYVEVKGKYDNIRFYSKVYSSMFKELDSLKIFLSSQVKNKMHISVYEETCLNNNFPWQRLSGVLKRYSDPSHLMTFYYTRKSETEQNEE